MSVIRVEKTSNYTVMSNYHLQDHRLSFKAVGLMCWMLSLPDDWDYSVAGISAVRKEGRDAIRAALKELEDAGYLTIELKHDKGGKFETIYTLHEKPKTLDTTEKTGKPLRKNRNGKTVTENPTQINTNNKSTKEQKKESKKDGKRLSYSEILSSLVKDPDVREALSQYVQMRIAKKSYPTNKALELLIKRLDELSTDPQEQLKIVEQAIRGGYMDFKPIRKEAKRATKPNVSMEHFDPEKHELAVDAEGKPLMY